jgi:hypothetical protein
VDHPVVTRSLRVLGILLLIALLGDGALAQLSQQGPYQSATTGYIDPTVATFNTNKPLVACAGGCSTALINQNTDALQKAVDTAQTTKQWIYIPPGEYPLARGGTAHTLIYGVQLFKYTDITIIGRNATLRASGTFTNGSTYYMFYILGNGTARIRFYGLTFSQRDIVTTCNLVSGCSDQMHDIRVGDGNLNTQIDDIRIVGCKFHEPGSGATGNPQGGDAIDLVGGIDASHLIQRLYIADNVIKGNRAAITFQHGTDSLNIVGNHLSSQIDQAIDHEPTSPGGNLNENIVGNFIPTATSSGDIITVSLSGKTDNYAGQIAVVGNWIDGGINGINVRRDWFVDNVFMDETDVTGSPQMEFFRRADDMWFVGNVFHRGPGSVGAQQLYLTQNNGFAPRGAWVRGNRFEQWGGNANIASVQLDGVTEAWVTDNTMSYHGSFVDAGNNGYIGVFARSQVQANSGWITGNIVRKALQADGVTAAGRMLYGVDFSSDSYPHIAHGWVRDNYVDGARATVLMTQAALDEGVPVVSGNVGVNVASDGYPIFLRTESTGMADVVAASGTLSPSKRVAFLALGAGNQTHTLPDGVVDGQVVRLKWTASTGGGDTITPTHFGDGTSVSVTTVQAAGGAHVELAWDATNSKWWLVGVTSATVNP